jgi:methionyl-tRNA formyltransferase
VRILLCGKNDTAAEALEFLRERGDEVLAVGTASDSGRDGWQRSLVGAARARDVACEQPARINDPAAIARLSSWRPDLLISIQYDQILKEPFFRGIGCPCVNLHFALLPRNRGVAPIAWALLEGDARTGATFHHMLVDIDAGDVVAQRAVAIAADDTGRALYDKVSRAATELFREAYPFGPQWRARRIPQDPRLATYHRNGELDFSRRDVDWSTEAARLQRWLRAFIFPPFQYPLFELAGRRLAISAVAGEVRAARAAPGSLLAASPAGLEVAAGGGSLRILGCAEPDGRPVPLSEVAARARVGTVLASHRGGP